ncbi:hypothetical protein GCM10025734_16270 [Kitasatospora paranensis]
MPHHATFALLILACICENYSPHLTTRRCQRVGTWAATNNVEIAYTPTNSSWLNRIEAQFTALRYFALDGTDHPSHQAQGSMIRRYIIWRSGVCRTAPPSGFAVGVPVLAATFGPPGWAEALLNILCGYHEDSVSSLVPCWPAQYGASTKPSDRRS